MLKKQSKAFEVIMLSAVLLTGLSAVGCAQQGTGKDAPTQIKPNLPAKKFIEFGWDQFQVQDPAYLRDNIREMEKRPFDGVVFRLAADGGEIFNLEAWDPKALEPQLEILKDIKWDKFTDNFVAVFSESTMDWFSEKDWEKVLAHTKFCARAAKAARCKGIMFDPEPYGGDRDLWFDGKLKAKSGRPFSDYIAQAHKRGSQFMNALQGEMPEITILTLFGYQRFYHQSHSGDPAIRDKTLNGDGFALMGAFFDGMLEVAGEKVRIIDGNEHAYYYKTPIEYYRSYLAMRHGAKVYAAPDVREKYDRIVRAGQALYVDYAFSLRPDVWTDIESISQTPEERARQFEHNAYYALQASDEYVWVYSENMHWWKNVNIPPGLEEAMISAKAKVARGDELGFKLSKETMKLEPPAVPAPPK